MGEFFWNQFSDNSLQDLFGISSKLIIFLGIFLNELSDNSMGEFLWKEFSDNSLQGLYGISYKLIIVCKNRFE